MKRPRISRSHVVSLAALLALAALIAAPARADEAQELAKKLSNPISDMVSVPFQFNWEFGEGTDQDTWQITNIQPVVPFNITDKTAMIARLIMPTINMPTGTVSGDMVFSLFFSPLRGSGTVWGVGPVFQLPRTGEKWGVGPTAVVVKMKANVTYGALVNQVWSVAGDENAPDLNQTFLQPFFAVTNSKAITFTIQSETTANWEAPSGDEWSIPLNLLVSKLAKFGPFPASYAAGAGVYLDSPPGGPEWKLRAVMTMLLPSK